MYEMYGIFRFASSTRYSMYRPWQEPEPHVSDDGDRAVICGAKAFGAADLALRCSPIGRRRMVSRTVLGF